MSEWRTDPAGHGLGGRHRRDHPHGDVRPLLGFLQHGGGHGENPWVTRRYDGHGAALLSQFARQPGTLRLVGVIGGMAALPRTDRHPVQIGAVADQVGGGGQLTQALRRHPVDVARPQSDNRDCSGARGHSGGAAITRHDGNREVRHLGGIDVGGGHDPLTFATGPLDVDRLIEPA